MRSRGLLKEPCGQTLCTLCARQLNASRQVSHVQRRYLQYSRSKSNQSTTGPAPQNDEQSQQRGPVSGGGFGPVAGASWGGAFGGIGSPSAGAGRSWSGSNTTLSPQSSGYDGSAVQVDNLLPHEQKARDLLSQREEAKSARIVTIHAGSGPASTRAGRPIISSTPSPAELEIDKRRRQGTDEGVIRASRPNPRARPDIRRIIPNEIVRHEPVELQTSSPLRRGRDSNNQESGWTGLRRIGSRAPSGTGAAVDGFAEARLKREQEATSRRYIPLGHRAPFVQRNSDERFGNNQSATLVAKDASPPNPGFTIRRSGTTSRPVANAIESNSVKATNPAMDPSLAQAQSQSHSKVTYSPMLPPEPPQTSLSDWQRSSRDVSKDTKTVDNEGKEEAASYTRQRQPRASSRFEVDSMPKGKAKDKAKRRQRFLENHEEPDEDTLSRQRRELKEQRKREKAAKKALDPVPVLLPEFISVSNLAIVLKVRFEDFVAKVEELGFEDMSHDHILNAETAGLIAQEYNFEPIIDRNESEDLKPRPPPDNPSSLPQRPPVVTIMGHVDHGKTTLLDWLRKSSVAATEHGGITQHIGAFSVPMPGGKLITFLDTPGHAAFLSMRQRGANVTDIVILVVAADDSVKPQTIEAINHAKAAKVPIIVAINKIDKEDSDIERVKQDLSRHGVEIEDYGGDTQVICVSGKTGQGMENLEEAAVTLSEILDMRAEQDGQAEGWVLEASIKPLGKTATVLVRRGTMRAGDFIVAGNTWARIRTLRNEAGTTVAHAGPGTPVQIDGWKDLPLAGDEVLQAPDESKAKSVVEYRLDRVERDKLAEDMEAVNEYRKEVEVTREKEREDARVAAESLTGHEALPLPEPEKSGGPKNVYFIVKGDVSGSVEAVIDSINGIGNGEVQPYILRSGVGQLSEFDIEHAAAAKGHVINFNTSVDENVVSLAKYANVSILDNNVIYRLVDDVKKKLSEYLPPKITQRVLGEAEIAQVFEITVKGRTTKAVAGCKVRNGVIGRNARVRVLRDGEKVFDGALASLKNQKKDVMEMRNGTECGIGFENWFDFQVGDKLQAYEEKEEKRYL
ncbi:hypothetical protein BP5796_06070 [Coleophoma crateriformis]|uniref:Translation initiation factor IF-2, mitochondrial n=1 Tax=Coleophoma crateriformis TaxID=565419 RepID=A0A3D8RW40_9HELO|nr:hypothetical protein BP5796_06070 [Coleophoma crateriformis]